MSVLSGREWPELLELTPKDVLVLLVDLNERYHGAFERVAQAMDEALEALRQDEGLQGRAE